MIELAVLTLPIVAVGIEVYRKIFACEQSAIEHVNLVNEHGVEDYYLEVR